MVLKRLALLSPFALVLLSLWGCGGGSGASPASSGDALTRANAQLNQMSSGLQPSDSATLNATLSLFNDALKQNPGSPQALFGQTICQAGLTAATLETNFGLPVSAATTGSGSLSAVGLGTSTGQATPPSPGNHPTAGALTASAARLGLFWHVGETVGNSDTLLMPLTPLAGLRYGLIPLYGYAADDVANRQQALQQLNTVTQNLQTLEANPKFATTLIIVGSPRGGSKIGLPEVYLFDAYINSLRAQLALSLAYNRDPGINNPLSGPPLRPDELDGGVVYGDDPIGNENPSPHPPRLGASYGSLDTNGDGKLTPDEYLAASPFLTLRDAGMLQTAKQALLAAADKQAKGIQGIFARPTISRFQANGNDGFLISNIDNTIPNSIDPNAGVVITNSSVTHVGLDYTLNNIPPILKQATVGTVTLYMPLYAPATQGYVSSVPAKSAVRRHIGKTRRVFLLGYQGGTDAEPFQTGRVTQVTFNLAAWIAHPPADLKAFAPTYTLQSGGYIDFTKTTYPDPTFGGLYPNGLPDELLL